ncbi:MAG TPA: Uma2 family endonuclease [Gemmataceae bacterium]|jgi:Uma2 family endonuclease
MSLTNLPRAVIEVAYAEYAREYLRSLPLEHFMEATAQATQRKITLESFDLVHASRPEVQAFNELLVQYPRRGQDRPGQIVPDNMVVLYDKPIDADGSYDVPLQPVGPFWVMEYVSKYNKRKDYEKSFDKYERELKVPYYLMFYPDNQELTLYHLRGRKYVSVKPNEHGRYAVPELEMEIALLDGWVRFWHQGALLPLPAELQQRAERAEQRAEMAEQRAETAEQRAETAEQQIAREREARLALERELEELHRQLKRKSKPS